jgi:hypothetical protein
MRHTTIEGTILYTSKKPEMLDQKRGFERFLFTHHSDGAVTLRAHCEIEEPAPSVLRDIVYALDAQGAPKDCLLRLTVGDAFMGAGFFRFLPDMIECESYGPSIGRVSQRVPLSQKIDGFGTHPIVADGYFLGVRGLKIGERRTFQMYLPSPDHRGATPPIVAPVKIDGEYVKDETVTTPAGTFACRHMRFIDPGDSGMSGAHPIYDLWITADKHAIFVKGGVGGYMQTWYELQTLTITPGS